MNAVGVVRHLLYTSKILLIFLELNHLVYKHVYCIYIYAMKAVVVVSQLFYSSNILLIFLELNNLNYKPVHCIYIRNERCWCD